MNIIKASINTIPKLGECAVTLGNFDGVHAGHQTLISQLVKTAKKKKLKSVVITFEPMSKVFFSKNKTVPQLMSLTEKTIALSQLGVDYFLCLRFDKTLAAMTAQEFIQAVFVKLSARAFVLGYDTCFGSDRAGNATLLKSLSIEQDWAVDSVSAQTVLDQPISSSRIRQALSDDDLSLAEQLLGQPFFFAGRVMHGHQRGREWGVPTANIHVSRPLTPVQGVFAVKVLGLDKVHYGVANIGTRPTVDGSRVICEVYLYDFNEDIYGRRVCVALLKKIRNEVRFDSIEKLIAQIHQDVKTAENFLTDQGFLR